MPPKKITATKHADKRTNIPTEARNLWVLAINNHGGYGRWAFLEIRDPWDVLMTIRSCILGSGGKTL